MSDDTPEPPPQPGSETGATGWDPQTVMRDRAAATRKKRDDSIRDLRASMGDDDEAILDEFGINLDQIER